MSLSFDFTRGALAVGGNGNSLAASIGGTSSFGSGLLAAASRDSENSKTTHVTNALQAIQAQASSSQQHQHSRGNRLQLMSSDLSSNNGHDEVEADNEGVGEEDKHGRGSSTCSSNCGQDNDEHTDSGDNPNCGSRSNNNNSSSSSNNSISGNSNVSGGAANERPPTRPSSVASGTGGATAVERDTSAYNAQESMFGPEQASKQRFQYILAAPTSAATKISEDTMTYLNQGQAYEIKLNNVTDISEGKKGFMCSIINIGFHERHMQQAENELWQQWSQQHPGERIFSVDMKLSYNVFGVESDGLNKYEFLWDSSKAAGVFIRINSISTEFTLRKHGGEKGIPFKLSIETFSYNSKTHDSYFISAACCQIKVFKPKGAERKIRSDRDKFLKRPEAEQDKYHRSSEHTLFSQCPLSSLHPMVDGSLRYYRHSHGHFASKQIEQSTSGTPATLALNHHHHHSIHHHSSPAGLDHRESLQQQQEDRNSQENRGGSQEQHRQGSSCEEENNGEARQHHPSGNVSDSGSVIGHRDDEFGSSPIPQSAHSGRGAHMGASGAPARTQTDYSTNRLMSSTSSFSQHHQQAALQHSRRTHPMEEEEPGGGAEECGPGGSANGGHSTGSHIGQQAHHAGHNYSSQHQSSMSPLEHDEAQQQQQGGLSASSAYYSHQQPNSHQQQQQQQQNQPNHGPKSIAGLASQPFNHHMAYYNNLAPALPSAAHHNHHHHHISSHMKPYDHQPPASHHHQHPLHPVHHHHHHLAGNYPHHAQQQSAAAAIAAAGGHSGSSVSSAMHHHATRSTSNCLASSTTAAAYQQQVQARHSLGAHQQHQEGGQMRDKPVGSFSGLLSGPGAASLTANQLATTPFRASNLAISSSSSSTGPNGGPNIPHGPHHFSSIHSAHGASFGHAQAHHQHSADDMRIEGASSASQMGPSYADSNHHSFSELHSIQNYQFGPSSSSSCHRQRSASASNMNGNPLSAHCSNYGAAMGSSATGHHHMANGRNSESIGGYNSIGDHGPLGLSSGGSLGGGAGAASSNPWAMVSQSGNNARFTASILSQTDVGRVENGDEEACDSRRCSANSAEDCNSSPHRNSLDQQNNPPANTSDNSNNNNNNSETFSTGSAGGASTASYSSHNGPLSSYGQSLGSHQAAANGHNQSAARNGASNIGHVPTPAAQSDSPLSYCSRLRNITTSSQGHLSNSSNNNSSHHQSQFYPFNHATSNFNSNSTNHSTSSANNSHSTSTPLALSTHSQHQMSSPAQRDCYPINQSSAPTNHHHHVFHQEPPGKFNFSSSQYAITINSSCTETASWLMANRFGLFLKTFNNFSGSDLLRLSKRELIEICGLLDGIRLYNSLHNQPIRPKRILYVCNEGSDSLFHPIYLYDVTLKELLRELSSVWLNYFGSKGASNCGSQDEQQQRQHRKKSLTDRSSTSRSSVDGMSSVSETSGTTGDNQSDSFMANNSTSNSNSNERARGNLEQRQQQRQNHDLQEDNDVGEEAGEVGNQNHRYETQHDTQTVFSIQRLLIQGLTFVKVIATDQMVQMLENESAWILSVNFKASGLHEACISACRLLQHSKRSTKSSGTN